MGLFDSNKKEKEEEWKPQIKQETIEQAKQFLSDPSVLSTPELKKTEISETELQELVKSKQKKWIQIEELGVLIGPDGVYYTQTPFDNPLFRQKVEKQSEEIDTSELVRTGRLSQLVKISDDFKIKFVTLLYPEIQTISELARKDIPSNLNSERELAATIQANSNYLETLASIRFLQYKCSENQALIVDDPIIENKFDKNKLIENIEYLKLRIPSMVLNIILIQYIWFKARISEFVLPENIKNF
jgi:hypothetical protein